jgi:D-alanyl-D-alanine dipeptidase
VGAEQKQRRLMLKSLMEKNGFRNIAEEWWHFTLVKEPFRDQYFDFLVR